MKIAYLVLHYMAGKETIECVESILNTTRKSEHETSIIVVDNGSTNNSMQEIMECFQDNQKVVLIRSKENLGFSRGNNLGFKYAKYEYRADFIVQLNNDTVLTQIDFNERLVNLYYEKNFAVLGPDIITLDGCHQNPGKVVNWSVKKLYLFGAKKAVQFFLANFSIFDKFLTVNAGSYPNEKIEHEICHTQLHGACLIFSPSYISAFEGMNEQTFLYMEEDILKLMADHYGFLMMYSPGLEILHKEDISSNMVAEKGIDQKRNVYKNLLKSSRVYLKLKKQYERE